MAGNKFKTSALTVWLTPVAKFKFCSTTIPPPIWLFGTIVPADLGTNISAPLSPTIYGIFGFTFPPIALAPPKLNIEPTPAKMFWNILPPPEEDVLIASLILFNIGSITVNCTINEITWAITLWNISNIDCLNDCPLAIAFPKVSDICLPAWSNISVNFFTFSLASSISSISNLTFISSRAFWSSAIISFCSFWASVAFFNASV